MNKSRLIFPIILIFLFSCAAGGHSSVNVPASAFSLTGLSGLENAHLSGPAREKLASSGFVVTPSRFDEMHEIYDDCKKNGRPVFVTTDSILHTSHLFFNYILRILEVERLYGFAGELTDKMLKLSETQYYEALESDIKELARLNMAFFSVAKKMLDPDFTPHYEVSDIVEKELANIKERDGIKPRSLMTYVDGPNLMMTPYAYEDFTQYIPRGHYTRNETLKKYFLVMMWFGRMDFKLRPGRAESALSHGKHMTLQAILMADAFLRDDGAFALWKKLYEPTAFFVGETDDLDPRDYMKLINEIYPESGAVDKYSDQEKLALFIEEAMKLKPPKVLSGFALVEEGDPAISTKGFRLMGQRFIPDSYIFQELVFGKKAMKYTGQGNPFTLEYLPNAGPARAFPRGLDILAVFGSDAALDILREEGDADYEFYYSQMSKLRREFAALDSEEWRQNLYWRSLFSLLPLLEETRGEHVQEFMRRPEWELKKLQTALGAWTELRHDTILYAKQTYTMGITAVPPEPEKTFGYVEPYSRVYGRIQAMMKDIRENMDALGIGIEEVVQKLKDFESLLSSLQSISNKQLGGRPLSEGEYDVIREIGGALAGLTEFPPELMEKIISKEVDSMTDIVVDVHTEPNTRQVLQEGVGQPFNIYVIIDDAQGYRLCRGPVFSYYEFKHPMADRLTDEKWQAMRGRRPPKPPWTQRFIVK